MGSFFWGGELHGTFSILTLVAGSKLDVRDTEPLHCELLVITIQFHRLIMKPPPPPWLVSKLPSYPWQKNACYVRMCAFLSTFGVWILLG
jgi:hypothetical protein